MKFGKTSNAIDNSLFKIMREASYNMAGRPQRQQTQCARCGSTMYMEPTPDGRMGVFTCKRCGQRLVVRLG
jgi:hypothetical protein